LSKIPEQGNSLGGNMPGTRRLHSEVSAKYRSTVDVLRARGELAEAQIVYFNVEPAKNYPVAGADAIVLDSVFSELEPTEHHPLLLYMDVLLYKDGVRYDPIDGDIKTEVGHVIVTGQEMPPKLFRWGDEAALVDPERYEGVSVYMLTDDDAEAVSKVLAEATPQTQDEHIKHYGL